ncbi:MAG: LysM peptidoglycan-binding domain-containing protein [Flavobacteriaceae bacterium]|nr:glucosaminidase domain-containing protein [Bacteroidia bacterium]NNL16670.1 LysM peptidoglycan-binding domain-containing protein [Flavobacteriaceae bacterium]
MKFKRIFVLIALVVFISGCGTKKGVITKKSKAKNESTEINNGVTQNHKVETKKEKEEVSIVDTPEVYANSTEEYIAIYSDIAQDEMRQYGVPASITLAQGILESSSGKGRLAVEGNNHFGIKCHDWTGARIIHDDDEKGECFRKYKNSKYSFKDHSVFLTSRKRYHKLFILEKDDYKGWSKGLKAAGYATDRKYPQKLISIIERYQLYRFDAQVIGKEGVKNDRHTVVTGDTLYSLSKKYNLSINKLKQLNGLDSDNLFVGQVLYVKPLPKDF